MTIINDFFSWFSGFDSLKYPKVKKVEVRLSTYQSLLHRGVEEGATPSPRLLHFTLDPYFIMLGVKHGGINYHFWVFSMTRPGIETGSPGPLANILAIRPIAQ